MVDQKMIGGAIALVILAATVLVGLAVVESFSKTFRDDSGTTNMTMTSGAVNVSTLIGTTGQYPYPQTLTICVNDTDVNRLTSDNYTFTEGTANGGFLTILDSGSEWASQTDINCTGTYLLDSTLQGHADNFSTGLAIFGSFIGVLVIAILGMFVMRLFSGKKDD